MGLHKPQLTPFLKGSNMTTTRKNLHGESGFTLVELVVVIALIALVSSLAISRLGNVKEASRAKMNVANLARLGTAVDAFLSMSDQPKLDRMDSLLFKDAAENGDNANNMSGSISLHVATSDGTNGVALNSGLATSASYYGGGGAGLLCPYWLTAADVTALQRLGFTYLMYGTDGSHLLQGEDGSWSAGSILDPDQCMSYARALTNGLQVAVVNPGAIMMGSGTATPIGALAYRSCGQDVRYSLQGKVLIDGVAQTSVQDAFNTLNATGGDGILLALGLGAECSMIGNNAAGLDHAPTCPVITAPDEYARYLILFRLRTDAAGGRTATYAGILDPLGQTIDRARASLK